MSGPKQSVVIDACVDELGVEFVITPTGAELALVGGQAYGALGVEFSRLIAATYRARVNGQDHASPQAIRTVVHARLADAERRDVDVRVASRRDPDGALISTTIDVASGRGLEIDAGGARIVEASFARPVGSSNAPVDLSGNVDDLRQFRRLVGLDRPEQWAGACAWMMGAWVRASAYPLLLLTGEQGSGKTTTAWSLREIVDPRDHALGALPDDVVDLAVSCAGNHASCFDNASRISRDVSDALCRVATGGAISRRRLYSDADVITLSMSRPLLITSIGDAADRPDLLDRSIRLELPVRTDRSDPDRVASQVRAMAPRVRGALARAMSAGIRGAARVDADALRGIRLVAPAALATAAEPELGLPAGAVARAFRESRRAALDVASVDPVVTVLDRLLGDDGALPYTCQLADLIQRVADRGIGDTGFPRSANALSLRLRELAPALRRIGVTFTRHRQGGTGRVLFTFTRERTSNDGE